MLRAVLFDLGNTLVRYFRREAFPQILRECLRCAAAAINDWTADPDSLFEKALASGREAGDFAVRRLEDRILNLFPGFDGTDALAMSRVCRA